ncbi:N,N-dimethylformamidase beta subunit family domain-containing protein [Mesorhizobium sp. IMUNJ 23232]|uniref:N,N-dimethylformamidase beta subunit family domain-containing protein n=1 Tax=Mesorhizobium sp. IMUNJ 23232 TaxID=3376064 RepID=UPI0037AD118A
MPDKKDFLPPELGPLNIAPRVARPMHADDHWHSKPWYEAPHDNPALPEVYTYTDTISYDPGEEVVFHSSTTAPDWTLEIYRDGYEPETVHRVEAIEGKHSPTPPDAYRNGCNWPVSHRWRLPVDLPSGFYRVVSTCARANGGKFVQHHFFVVRPTEKTRQAKILMVLPTATWTAYNDFGGANHYFGIVGSEKNLPSPVLSLERPWTRGIVWLPAGAPRICADPLPEFGDAPRYAMKEWAFANGFGQYYAAAGWAQFDRHFVLWAEKEGYALDMITQTDLHYRPDLLDAYPCVTIIGHDEYWTREMRLSIEAYVERGGRLARFGANFLWQIRLEDDGKRQICHKFKAIDEDPVAGTDKAHLLSTAWEDRQVRWPGASTVGVNGLHGLYASWGGFAPHGQRGFTVYRPEHWAFAGTGLHYADIFGDQARIFAYEVDGLDYTFHQGLPYPVPVEGQPETIDILAMAPAVLAEDEPDGEGFRYYVRSSDHEGLVKCVTGEVTPEGLARYKYGSGMMVHMKRGKGEVLTAASCEWVMGLKRGDLFTQQITRNVLDRFVEV